MRPTRKRGDAVAKTPDHRDDAPGPDWRDWHAWFLAGDVPTEARQRFPEAIADLDRCVEAEAKKIAKNPARNNPPGSIAARAVIGRSAEHSGRALREKLLRKHLQIMAEQARGAPFTFPEDVPEGGISKVDIDSLSDGLPATLIARLEIAAWDVNFALIRRNRPSGEKRDWRELYAAFGAHQAASLEPIWVTCGDVKRQQLAYIDRGATTTPSPKVFVSPLLDGAMCGLKSILEEIADFDPAVDAGAFEGYVAGSLGKGGRVAVEEASRAAIQAALQAVVAKGPVERLYEKRISWVIKEVRRHLPTKVNKNGETVPMLSRNTVFKHLTSLLPEHPDFAKK